MRISNIQKIAPLALAIAAPLQALAASYTWNSGSSGNWSDTTANGWNTGGAYPSLAGDVAILNQPLTSAATITLNVSNVSVGAMTLVGGGAANSSNRFNLVSGALTFDNGASDASLTLGSNDQISSTIVLNSNLNVTTDLGGATLASAISGAGGVIKNGSQNLLMQGYNTYTGTTVLNNGTIRSQSASANPFGTGSMVLNGGTLQLNYNGATTLTAATHDVSSTVAYAGGGVINFNQAATTTFTIGNASVANSALVRSGHGTLQLRVVGTLGTASQFIVNGLSSAANINGIYDATVVSDNNAQTAGSFVRYDNGSDGFVNAAYTTYNASGAITSNSIADVTANMTASNGSNPYALRVNATSSAVQLSIGNGSTLKIGSDAASATSSGIAGLILNPVGSNRASIVATGDSSGILDFGAAEGAVYVSAGTQGGYVQAQITGSGGLTKFGPGTLYLRDNNSFTGGVNINQGTLTAFNGFTAALGDSSNDVNITAGTLDLGGNSISVGSLSGLSTALVTNSNAASATLTSNVDAGTSTFAGTIKNGTGTVALVKQGAGTLVLGGTNTYTGQTQVTDGVLTVNGSLAAGSSVIVGNTSTSGLAPTLAGGVGTAEGGVTQMLAGKSLAVYQPSSTQGALLGNVTLSGNSAGSAGRLAPGNSVGTMQVGSLTLNNGSFLNAEFNATANDFVNVNGALDLSALSAGNGVGVDVYQEGSTTAFATNGTYALLGAGNVTLPGGVSNVNSLFAVSNAQTDHRYTFSSNASTQTIDLTIAGPTQVSAGMATSPDGTVTQSAAVPLFVGGGTGLVAGTVNVSSGLATDNPTTILFDLGDGANQPSAAELARVVENLNSYFGASLASDDSSLLAQYSATLGGGNWDLLLAFPGAQPGSFQMTWDLHGIGLNGADASVTAVGVVPEPATLGLFAIGAIGLLRRSRRRCAALC